MTMSARALTIARRALPVLLFTGLGVFCLARAIEYRLYPVLVPGGVASLVIALGLGLGARWGRWVALGLAWTAFANGATAFALGSRPERDPRFGSAEILAGIAIGAVALVALLISPGARRQFEPSWSGRAFAIVRAAAVLSVPLGAVAALEVVWGYFGSGGQLPLERIAALAALVLGFALLAANRVAGLPVLAGGIVFHAGLEIQTLDRVELPVLVRMAAARAESLWLFDGPYSRVAWAPALFATAAALTVLIRAFLAPRQGHFR
jgi:hypothetical protein